MLTAKADMHSSNGEDRGNLKLLAEKFGVPELNAQNCPSIVFMPRGGSVHDKYHSVHMATSDDFRLYVWSRLQMTVKFVNKTPWVLKYWWVDGFNGKAQEDILVDDVITVTTFLSHAFFFRADFVEGYLLNNEVR